MRKLTNDMRQLKDDIQKMRNNRSELRREMLRCVQKRKEEVRKFLDNVWNMFKLEQKREEILVWKQ